jgi:site-specific DNA-cytosine methylase
MRYNHDPAYNQNLSDSGVTYVQYEAFESLFDNKNRDSIDDFMEKHGRKLLKNASSSCLPFLRAKAHSISNPSAIDIVIGGPPCQDFSRANANRQKTKGTQGSYLPQFGQLIKLIKESEDQGSHPLFFFAENVVLDFEDVKKVEEAFGCTTIMLDAQHFSPTKRNRHYWMNVRIYM